MKDRYSIINEEFDTLTGTTTVTINTDYGTFTGKTKLDNIDAEYPSIFHANEIALAKALRKYAKHMALITREKLQPLYAIVKQYAWTAKNTNTLPWGHVVLLISREIEKLEKELDLWQKRIEATSSMITNRITARDKIIKTYYKNKDNNN
jgi:hypothetical protein